MNKKEAKKRIEKLKEEIRHHRYLYHVLDKQEISDAAFDSLKHELFKLEQKYPDLITSDSPTQRVGGKPLEKFEKVKHDIPMLSIEDVFNEKELKEWKDRILRKLKDTKYSEKDLDYFAEKKIDGFAISLIYKKGAFIEGSTRGNGKIGENVTQNLKTIGSIPLKLGMHKKMPSEKIRKRVEELIKNGEIEIRGEVYMTKKSFEEINRKRKKEDKAPYSNPRNTAAGSIRQLDPKLAASRDLKFLGYDIVTDLGQEVHEEEHAIIRALGFKVDEGKYCRDLDEAVDYYKKISKKRKNLPFQIDGVVIAINNNDIFDKLGSVGKAHRGMIAFKFPGEQATTKIKDIKIQVGRTGALTPVAVLDPINLSGAKISRATLHNQDEIERLGVKIGDTAVVQRAGDVIPDVVKVLTRLRTGKEKEFHMPKKCPVCGSGVVKPKGEAVHRCVNTRCGAILKKKIYHFVSKKAFDIEGLGPKVVDQLMDKNLISDQADIFNLKKENLVPLERFADKSAENLIQSIDNSKEISASRFIYSLGIRHVGEEEAVNIAEHFTYKKSLNEGWGLINELKKTNQEDLEKIKDTGERTAESIKKWFDNKENLKLLKKLKGANIKINLPKIKKSKKLKGKTIVFTGELDSMTRDEAKSRVRELGGDPSSSISKNTDLLVVGENPGSKYDQAKDLGVKIAREKEFLNIIK
ncbi:MAG: NAD-dependent DNA ligase LigA [Candidatus Portnoybacteria bacterium]|nr:NAD-dependent DNA ligase LigA [Candidatus Portnoybacteria bacterium]